MTLHRRLMLLLTVLATALAERGGHALELVQEVETATSGKTNAARSAPSAASELPMERQPYRILVHLTCSTSARIDEPRRSELLKNWQVLARSYVGAPWVLSIAPESSPNGLFDLRTLKPEMLRGLQGFDKAWLIHVDRSQGGKTLELLGREYDAATRQVGPLLMRKGVPFADAPRGLLRFTLDLFNPTAIVTGEAGGRALLNVRGLLIQPASPIGAVVKKGSVFLPMRIAAEKGQPVVRKIRYTYLEVESVDGPVARCAIISGLKSPLTQRTSTPTTIAAVGIKPGNSAVRLQFETRTLQVTKPGEAARPPIKAPAAGYLLTARTFPDGPPWELGLTDRTGRIVLQPGFADGLVILRLLAGNVEPMVELAMMPGETDEERVITITPLPETVALEAELEALKDEVVDLVAMRKRLEGRMKARLEGEDWDGLRVSIKEYEKLPPRDDMAKKLAAIREDAVKRNAASKVGVLTKTAQAQLNDMQSMIDAYLEDETLRSYSDALERSQAEKATVAIAKARATAKIGGLPKTAAPNREFEVAKPEPPVAKPEPAPSKPKPTAPTVPF